MLRVLAGLLGVWIPVSALTSAWAVAAEMILGLLVLLAISVRQLDIRGGGISRCYGRVVIVR